MELILLDSVTFQEKARYDNFESLVWNERYQAYGDFQLQTSDVALAEKVFGEFKYFAIDTSPTIMRVKSRNLTMDEDGKLTLQINGETIDAVYLDRPAVANIVATSTLDAEYPEGWEFGDRLSDTYNLDPSGVAKQIFNQIDINHYGNDELKRFATPINMLDLTNSSVGDFHQTKLPHYEVNRSQTVSDVFKELMLYGNYNMFLVRPDFWSFPDSYSLTTRPIYYVMRHPVVRDEIYFNFYRDDYSAYNLTNDISVSKNIVLSPHADGVLYTDLGEDVSGLDAKVKFFESDIEDLLPDELDRYIIEKLAEETTRENLSSTTLDLTIANNANDDQLFHPFYSEVNNPTINHRGFYLGDIVSITVPWTTDVVQKQVVEYVKVEDTNGYKEYPRFADVITGSGYQFKRGKDGSITFLGHNHPMFLSFMRRVQDKVKWL